jgi:hypothetical protein
MAHPEGQTLTNMQTWTVQPWHNRRVEHATPDPPRRWFGLRRAATAPQPVVDLREVGLPSDPESVIARLARLRDAGLITNAEFEKERRTLLGSDDTRS